MNDRLGGVCTNEVGNIRYYGSNPNNYIYFNCDDYNNQNASSCELWRIIGVFDGKVKIVRDTSIGSFYWDSDMNDTPQVSSSYNNNWETSSLNTLLNGAYLNNQDTTYYNTTSSSGSPIQVQFKTNKTGIKESTRDMISDTTWYLGGNNTASVYSNQMYQYERSEEASHYYNGNPHTTEAKIGLMYPSDYGYGADFEQCTKNIYSYSDTTCKNNDYLNKNAYTWLISPNSSNSYYAFYVHSTGCVLSHNVNNSHAVRPVLYLNSEQVIQDGHTGDSNDPIQLQ